ncbi:hypothetical protein TDB9533_03694 [Thalassocella blandensis]|nr:hypothetical protein TDB9533_03694 [Thalassocella blandensis]
MFRLSQYLDIINVNRDIPGLFFLPDFLDESLCCYLLDEARVTRKSILTKLERDKKEISIVVPQPNFVRGEQHNLSTGAKFSRVEFFDSNDKTLSCEYFPEYGEPGHELIYFRGNENLPDFLVGVLPSIVQMLSSRRLLPTNCKSNWRLTMNFYNSIDGRLAGFPFHVDIPANGVVTMILNIERQVVFEITNGDRLEALNLPVGALLILSGASRYEWKHRVKSSDAEDGVDKYAGRISLVLGVK